MKNSRLTRILAESRGTLALATPIVAGQLSQMLMGLLDSAMVGRLGVTQLAAAAFANNLIMVPFIWGIGLTTCIAIRVAQSHGAGDHRESGEVLRHGLVLAGLAGLLMTAIVYWMSLRLQSFGQAAEVAREARVFFVLVGISIVPGLLGFCLKQFSEAQGSAWAPTLIFLGAVPVNALLNWMLIYGNLGFPALGLDGAGLATLLARVLALLALALYVWRSPLFRAARRVNWVGGLRVERMRSMLSIGLPASLQILVEVAAFSAGAIMVGWISKDALAAHQIALTCISTSFMVPLGVAMAASMRIGQALGAKEWDRVRYIGFNAFGLSLGSMVVSALIFAFGGRYIAQAFVQDPEVITVATRLFLIAALFQLFDGLQVTAAAALRGISDATVPMLMCILAYWVVGLPVGYLLAFPAQWGPEGIWAGFAMGLALAAALLTVRFWKRSRALLAGHPWSEVAAMLEPASPER